jgi:hypothetical protein
VEYLLSKFEALLRRRRRRRERERDRETKTERERERDREGKKEIKKSGLKNYHIFSSDILLFSKSETESLSHAHISRSHMSDEPNVPEYC